MAGISRRSFGGLVMGAAVAGAGMRANAQEVTIKVADSFPPKHNIANHGTKWWMERVTELSKGKVKFQYFGAEQLGKLKDMLTLLQSGATDIAYVPPTFFEGKMLLSSVHSLPNMFSSSHVGGLAFYERIGMTEVRRHPDFVETVRAVKPGSGGYRDAIELEWRLR